MRETRTEEIYTSCVIPPPNPPLEIFLKFCKQKAKLKVNNEGDCKCLNHKFIDTLIIVLLIEDHLLFHLNCMEVVTL